jgi:type II pantothenate kinase
MSKSLAGPFCKLADAASYVACSWDLTKDEAGRAHWVEFFKRHLNTILKFGLESAGRSEEKGAVERAGKCRDEFNAAFDAFAAKPGEFGRVTILTLDQWRDGLLRKYGFVDPFTLMKNRENEKMLPLLAGICREIDSLDPAKQLEQLVLGIFAGNIFDMGADATAKAFLNSSPDFVDTRAKIVSRPWLIDHYDELAQRLLAGPVHRKAVFFVDNAGSDFVLGVVPMIRWLGKRGTRVVVVANERPTLNDMTIADVRAWWPRIVGAEPSMADLPVELVSSGTGEPLIDLSAVSGELNVAAADADLVILEGMGRGVESNLDAEFSCDAVNFAMIKDTAVAARHHGKLYDVVCRFWMGR